MKPTDQINSKLNEQSPPDNYIPLTVTHYPDLSQAVLKAKDCRFYDCWLILREEYKSQGFCSKEEAAILLSHQLNIEKQSAHNILNDGDGLFWHLAVKKGDIKPSVWLKSVLKICKHYNIPRVHSSVIIDLRQRWSTQERRAGIYEASVVKTTKTKAIPVSRETIEKRTGVSKTTQLRYEKKWHAEKEFNYMVCCDLEGLTEEEEYSRILDFTNDIDGEYRVKTIFGRKTLIKQIPNLFFDNKFEYGNKSTLKRLNKALRKTGETIASVLDRERIHPYVDSKSQTLYRKIKIWTGKITLNFLPA